ncbi:MAG: helix-turn-helix domain-containing protein [Solirubrobacteraceae bacterium]
MALLAAALRDDTLARSLREIYLSPLEDSRDGGAVLRETLRAYLAAERNASSAAAALGVARNTVDYRLRAIEKRLGRSLQRFTAELEVALALKEIDA